MSDKMTCPGCDSRTSSVLAAVAQGDPCPYCGMTADTILEVSRVRDARGDAELRSDLETALVRAGQAEGEAAQLRRILEGVRAALEEYVKEDR